MATREDRITEVAPPAPPLAAPPSAPPAPLSNLPREPLSPLQEPSLHRSIVESALDGIVVIDPVTRTVVDANDAYRELLGLTKDELHAMPLAAVIAAEPAALADLLERTLLRHTLHAGEQKHRRKGGALIDVEVFAAAVGEERYVCLRVRDITLRKRRDRLEQDARQALEMMARGVALTQVLLHLERTVEAQRPGSTCRIRLVRDPPAAWGTSHVVAVVISGANGGQLGVLEFTPGPSLDASGRPESTDDAGLLETIARLSGMAIEQRQMADQLAHQAHHDALTGLPNRRLFEDRLLQALASAQRTGKELALLFIDLDRFKAINDSLGHEAGDALLRELADRLRHIVRASDTVARLGGDEFTVILSDLKAAHDAVRVGHQLLEAISRPYHILGHELFLTASIGIAVHPRDGLDAPTLQRSADSAMYGAKQQGKNRVHCFTSEMTTAATERLSLESHLRRALENDEMVIHYQPERSEAGVLVGMESLLRWTNPKLGSVAPTRFIPVAEETGLIVPIGTWVLRRSFEQHAEWRRRFRPIGLAVNVSVLQFAQADFVETVAAALRDSGLDGRSVELELTESLLMRDHRDVRTKLEQLQKLGVRIAIDDFGTGYSSMSYLHRLPIDTLKIDQSFVKGLSGSADTLPLVQAIVALGHNLGLELIAEGVETAEQLETLRALGVQRMQGFHFGRPCAAAEAERFLERRA